MIETTTSAQGSGVLPAYKDWSLAAVRLLQGPVYSDDQAWELTLRYQSALSDYYARIGLMLIVDEAEGLAFLRQLADDEARDEYQDLPRLFRRTRLGYDVTLLCVLLRDELRRFEEEDVDHRRCVIEQSDLLDVWKSFFPSSEDEVRLHRSLESAFKKLETLRFVSRFGDAPGSWEVRRILKARLPVSELERLKGQLQPKEVQEPAHG
ncbi:MAG: DUF4194 domain-containing protein [Planctomycetales bacterium]|nr:DUF4194 domain-containing protein [Planctomycetales bacterium]